VLTAALQSRISGESAQRRDRAREKSLARALVLENVSEWSWRVCDARIPLTVDGRVLAFIDQKDGRIEVMQVGDRFIWNSFPTMRAAIRHITTTHVDMRRARAEGELSWLR
jgi:hypothetical protein